MLRPGCVGDPSAGITGSLAVSRVFSSIGQRIGLLSLETVTPDFVFFSVLPAPCPILLRYVTLPDSFLANHLPLGPISSPFSLPVFQLVSSQRAGSGFIFTFSGP